MRALDVGNDPAIGPIDENEIQRDRAAIVIEGDDDIGLVELLAKDRYRDGAELPCRALDQKLVSLILRRNPCFPQTRIKELPYGGGIVRQPVGEIRRSAAIVSVDVPDQRFR